MRKFILVSFLWVIVSWLMGGTARAQQVDAAFGVNALTAPSAASASGDHFPQSLSGGLFPSFSGDVLFLKNQFGISGEVSWRATRGFYQGLDFQPFRPIFYDFNGIWAPRVGKSVRGELMAGIGTESTRFYQPFLICSSTGCTNYVSSNHFLGHFGGGVRFYFLHHFFLRPEAHLYLVNNNLEFSSARATRFGLSLGYSLTSGE